MRVNHVHMMQLNLWSHKTSATLDNYTDLAHPHAQGNEYTTLTPEGMRQDKRAQVY